MPYKFYKHPILQRHSSTGLWKSIIILFTCRTFAASGPILGCTYFLAYPTYYILKLHSNKSNIHVNCVHVAYMYMYVCNWNLRWNFVLLLGSSHKINRNFILHVIQLKMLFQINWTLLLISTCIYKIWFNIYDVYKFLTFLSSWAGI